MSTKICALVKHNEATPWRLARSDSLAMAIRLRKHWPDIKLNETHPKVLYFAQANRKYNFCDDLVRCLCGREESFLDWTPANEHE
jgi:hypothetical protein